MKSPRTLLLLVGLLVPVLSVAQLAIPSRYSAPVGNAGAGEGRGFQVQSKPLAGNVSAADGYLWGLVYSLPVRGERGQLPESPMLAEWIVSRSTTTVSPRLSISVSAWSPEALSWSPPPAGQAGEPLLAPIVTPQAPSPLQIAQTDPVLLIPGDDGDAPAAPPLQREDSSTVPLPGTIWFLAPALGALTLLRKVR